MLEHILIYIASFFCIWFGAGLAIKSVERLSKSLKLSSFSLSFLILGFFTSVSELSVGLNAIIENDPEIYVGNLIGASLVIFLLIIPLLAISANGLKINQGFQGFNLLISVIAIAAPVILSIDGVVNRIDSIIAVVLYLFLVICIQMKRGLLEHANPINKSHASKILREFGLIVTGIAIIFIASKIVVDQTIYFSQLLQVSPFLISLLFIAIGTNIPELSLVARSVFLKKNQIAFGDYVGSASFNTFLFGLLTLLYGRPVYLTNSYLVSLLFLILGLLLFYYFAKTKHAISRIEGLLLLFLYIGFLLVELAIHF